VDQGEPVAAAPDERSSLSSTIAIALQVALLGSVLIGLGERFAAAYMIHKHFDHGDWPWRLILAAGGKAMITYLIVVAPLMTLGVVLLRLVPAIRRRVPIWALTVAAWVVLASILIVPYDVRIASGWHATTARVASAACLVSGLAVVAVIHRLLARSVDDRRVSRMLRPASAVALCLLVVCGTAFMTSPLFDPNHYRVPAASPAPTRRDRPNVLWIVMDTIRPDHMSAYGYAQDTTPFLESWAKQAAVFDNAVSNGRWTVPAHASMFTGASVRRHGADVANVVLDDGFDTVAEVLGRAGYATASFSSNPFVSRATKLAQGFDAAHVIYYLRKISKTSMDALGETWGLSPWLPWLDVDFGAAMTNRMVSDWLDAHATDNRPMFLFVNYMEAHLPYSAPTSYRRMFMSENQVRRSYQLRRQAYGDLIRLMDFRFNLESPDVINRGDVDVLKRQYDAAIRYVDDRVRELIGTFRQRGLLDNTLVVVASDHGENLDTHGMWSHRFLLYGDLTRVAMFVHEPGRREGIRVDTPVVLSDLYTTVLNVALGPGKRASPWESRDVLQFVNHQDPSRIVISETRGADANMVDSVNQATDPVVRHRGTSQVAASDARYRYIASGDGRSELFDQLRDPGELTNVAGQLPDEVRRLADYVDEWSAAVPFLPLDKKKTRDKTDPSFSKALRSLGYTGD